MTARTTATAYAPLVWKFWIMSSMSVVAVSVFPTIRPDTTATAPYSPRQRAVVRMTP